MNQHLTDEQFAELLADGYSPDHTLHLKTCTICSDEVERARSAILEFGTISLRGAQEFSATMVQPTRAGRSLLVSPPIWAATAGLVFTAALGVQRYESHVRKAAIVTTAHVHPEQDRRELLEDNALLSAIDADLRWKPDTAVNTPATLVLATHKSGPNSVVSE